MSKVSIKSLKSANGFKVLSISGESGDTLSNHKVNEKALLLMRSGNLIYKEAERMEILSAGDICDIPVDVFHKIKCTTKAKFFVIMPDQTKMKFEEK